jgi:hypothetical protein
MDILLDAKPKKDKGYHIREFDQEARRLAKAAATMAGVPIGEWISQAVREKFGRDIAKGGDRQ